MNKLVGFDLDEFNVNYPGVYDVYKQNCNMPNPTGDQKTSCCQTACNSVCKTSDCNGGADSCILNCPPELFMERYQMNKFSFDNDDKFIDDYPGVTGAYVKEGCNVLFSPVEVKTKCCKNACNDICGKSGSMCNGNVNNCIERCMKKFPDDSAERNPPNQMKNKLFGTDLNQFNTDYPGVYDVYKQNCNMPNPTDDQQKPCCEIACNVCNTANCTGGRSACILNCPPDNFHNIPSYPQDNSGVFNKCVGANIPGRCPRDGSIEKCYTQGCKNDRTCMDDNGGWFQNFCGDEGDWPGNNNVPPVSPDIPPYGPSPSKPKPRPRPRPRPKPTPTPSKPTPSSPSKPTPSSPSKPLSQSGLFSNLSTPQIVGVSIGGIIILVLIGLIIAKLVGNKY